MMDFEPGEPRLPMYDTDLRELIINTQPFSGRYANAAFLKKIEDAPVNHPIAVMFREALAQLPPLFEREGDE
jgi:hypothetical protein